MIESACRLLAALGMGYLSQIALDCTTPATIDLPWLIGSKTGWPRLLACIRA
ncbi:MAG TPA: hypothetical protein PKK20_02595 [Verrucomicrobiota bacterium]|nr:hypothetical protein [Verrucomicrobiota bacterium]